MTLTKGNAAGAAANTHTNVLNAFGMPMQHSPVEANPEISTSATIISTQHSQLWPQTFQPVAALKPDVLNWLLQGHPNNKLDDYALHGSRHGFSLQYNGP